MFFKKKKDKKAKQEATVEQAAAPAPAPVETQETPIDAIPVTVNEMKKFVVNCNKCGAALRLANGKTAYICPVCNSLLRIRTGTRIVKEVPVKEKYVHVTLTQEAARHILHAERHNKIEAIRKSYMPVTEESIKQDQQEAKRVKSTLESLIAQHIAVNKYDEGDVLVVDTDGEDLSVSSGKIPVID